MLFRSYFLLNVWHCNRYFNLTDVDTKSLQSPVTGCLSAVACQRERKTKFGEQSERFEEREAQGERSVPSRFGERIRSQALSAVMQRQ